MDNAGTLQPESGSGGTTKDRSTIDFVYTDLDNAVEIAQAVHAVGGTACDYDQLAAHLGLEAKGGGFRLRIIGARGFGLITYERGGRITLSDLGRKVIDPQQEKAARVDAFLCVELYNRVFEQFKGSPLPPPSGLERALVTLGVSEKVKDKARQVLQRSAKQAGFFDLSPDRLTKPAIKGELHVQKKHEEVRQAEISGQEPPRRGGTGGSDSYHPFIEGLLKTLPEPGTAWSVTGRIKWLQAASHVIDLIYTGDDQNAEGVEYIEITKKAI